MRRISWFSTNSSVFNESASKPHLTSATDESTSFYANVTVYGTLTNVEKITMADLNVYVDFAGYGAGKHDIPINVAQNPSSLVSFTVDKTSIQMTLTDEKASCKIDKFCLEMTD